MLRKVSWCLTDGKHCVKRTVIIFIIETLTVARYFAMGMDTLGGFSIIFTKETILC